ncbi:hypothetical protein [Salinarimonas rosea]|uniref:hypothetical protein n=1 Tax=Salinarimonas rosea TaxID=552063 RepID=UPI0004905F59|nr:hypothetical protein [Salinarimonas rosea]
MSESAQTGRFAFLMYAAKRWPLLLVPPIIAGAALLLTIRTEVRVVGHAASVDLALTDWQRQRVALIAGEVARDVGGIAIDVAGSDGAVVLRAVGPGADASEGVIRETIEALRADDLFWRERRDADAERMRLERLRAIVADVLNELARRLRDVRRLSDVAEFSASTIELLRFAEELDQSLADTQSLVELLSADPVISDVRTVALSSVEPERRYVAFTGAVGVLALVLLVLWLRFEKSRGGTLWRGRLAPLLATLRSRPTFKP